MNTRPKNRIRNSAVALTSIVALGGGFLAACNPQVDTADAGSNATTTVVTPGHDHGDLTVSAEIGLYSTMRTLWAEHMQWTYDTVVAFAADSDSLGVTMDRLLANQTHIGDAIKPIYGDEAGDALTALLEEHITDAVPVLTAARDGDTEALAAAIDEWNRNAREIGDFLADANPENWERVSMEQMMEGHISQTVAYAAAQLQGDYAESIRLYDEAADHMADMADMLSAGIIAQFPDKF